MTDQEHASTIRTLMSKLNAALSDAAEADLFIRLEIVEYSQMDLRHAFSKIEVAICREIK